MTNPNYSRAPEFVKALVLSMAEFLERLAEAESETQLTVQDLEGLQKPEALMELISEIDPSELKSFMRLVLSLSSLMDDFGNLLAASPEEKLKISEQIKNAVEGSNT